MKALTANPTYTAAKLATFSYLGFALYLSFSHIIGLFASWGSHQPWVAPLLVDSLMLLGKLIRRPGLSSSARRIGTVLQYAGAAASLAANMIAGDNKGDRIIGAMVIIGFLVIEWVADHLQPAQVDTAAEKKAKTAAAVAKAAATRAANKAAAEQAAQAKAEAAAAKRERAAMNRAIAAAEKKAAREATQQTKEWNEWAAEASAPTSPAPIGHDAAYL
jgi:hypothetical protein